VLFLSTATAAPLEEVLNSDLMRNFESQMEDAVDRSQLVKQLDSDTNLYTLFSKKSGPLQLIAWAAPNDKSFLPRKQTANRRKEYVTAERIFSRSDGLAVLIKIYVAHPHYAKIADLGLLPDLAALKPPTLQSDFALPVTIQGIETTAYRTRPGGLSVSIPVMSGALIHLSSERWEDLSSILDLAERLDIARLRLKLTS
jgi:hypothetical protein